MEDYKTRKRRNAAGQLPRHTVIVVMPQDTVTLLDEAARRGFCSRSEVIRRVCAEAFAPAHNGVSATRPGRVP